MGARGAGDQRRRLLLHPLIVLGLLIELTVVLTDVLIPGFDVPVAPLVVAPLLAATAGLVAATGMLSALALVLAVVLTAAHGDLAETDELIRLLTLAAVCGLAVMAARLRRTLDELAQALDALPAAVTIQTADGTVKYGNRAAARLAGEAEGVSPQAARAYLERMVVTDEAGAPLDPTRMPAQRLIAGQPADPVLVKSLDPTTGTVTWSRVQASPLRATRRDVSARRST